MMSLSLLRVTRFLSTLAVLVLSAAADAFSGTDSPGPELRQTFRPIGVSSSDCSFTPYLEMADQEADVSFSAGLGQVVSVGGGSFRFGSIMPRQSLTAAMLETRCGMTNVVILDQNGPTGPFATDTRIGISFGATPNGRTQTCVHEIALTQTGVTATTLKTRTAANTAPAANSGSNQTAASGQTETLSAAASSDPDSGQTLTYLWTQTGGPGVALSGTATASPAFTAPVLVIGAAAAVLTFTLTVRDGTDSATDTVAVTVTAPANTAPTADAGADQTVASGGSVTLDGSASAANDAGQTLTYLWTQTGGPGVAMSGTTTASPAFTARVLAIGAAAAVLTFTLTASDGTDSAAGTVAVTVRADANTLPTADAGPDQTADSGGMVTLDGTASSANDPTQTVTFQWSQTAGRGVSLSGAATGRPTFTAPVLTAGAADLPLEFALAVSDGTDAATDLVSVRIRVPRAAVRPTVTLGNVPPSFGAGESFTVLVTFSAPVTGFTAGDMVMTGGAEVSPSGEGPVFTARITPGRRESLTLQVPENAAVTLAGDGNTASAAVSILYDTSTETEQRIAEGLALRARQLIGSQPDLRSLFGPARGQCDAQVTQTLVTLS